MRGRKHRAAPTSNLPDTVDSNIPHRQRPGDCGAWHIARSVLVELALALHATPVRLRYQELEQRPSLLPIGIRLTAHLRTSTGRPVIVVYRSESAPAGPRGDYWSVTVNGVQAAHGTRNLPTPHHVATIAHRALTS